MSRYALISEIPHGAPRWFVLTLHHAVYDGWMLHLIDQMASQIYLGRAVDPGPDFKVFVQYITERSDTEAKNFWVTTLEGCESSPFPSPPRVLADDGENTDNNNGKGYSPRMESIELALPQNMRAKSSEVTESTLLRAAWAIVASGMTDSEHVSFGVVVSGRGAQLADITKLAGPTVATVPFFARLKSCQKVSEFLASVQQQAIDMIPFEQTGLQNIARMSASCRLACAFQTLLLVQPAPPSPIWDATGQWLPEGDEQISTYGLVIEVELGAKTVTASFDPDRLQGSMIQRLLHRFSVMLERLAMGAPEETLADVQQPTAQELEQIWEWNRDVPEPAQSCIHNIIREQALSQPHSTALESWDGRMTYQELDEYASGVADRIGTSTTCQHGQLIPVCFEKSMWSVVAILGVLKSGRGFVLLDPSLPEQRLAAICGQVGCNILISSHANIALSSRISQEQVIPVGPGSVQRRLHGDCRMEPSPCSPESLMYVVFTSGSTGTPKGVMVSHVNFCTSLRHQLPSLVFDPDSRVLDFASYAFDAAIHNTMATLAAGACLCIPSENDWRENLGGLFTHFSPTIANLTPTVARLIEPSAVPSLETLILLGEPVTAEDTRRWWEQVKLINTYGPAECTPISTINTDATDRHEAMRIGKGAGLITWIVDSADPGRLLPPGCVGELLLEGPLVGLGYLNDAQNTMNLFIEQPEWLAQGFPGYPGRCGRLYKTGDLVRYNEDGSLTFVGRKDNQVKVRGQRVELGDVEHFVGACVKDATQVVAEMCKASCGGSKALLCVFMKRVDTVDTESSHAGSAPVMTFHSITPETRNMLSQYLPSYMIPSHFFWVSELPQTATGKTDRRLLRELVSSLLPANDQSQEHSSWTTHADSGQGRIMPTEQHAYRLAQKVFSMVPSWAGQSRTEGNSPAALDDIPLHSSGLDSVNLMTLIQFCSDTFRVKILLRDLLDPRTTIRGLAHAVTTRQQGSPVDAEASHASSNYLLREIEKHYATIEAAMLQESKANLVNKLDKPLETPRSSSTRQLVVLLTGATGFIGTHILHKLLQHPSVSRVIALARGRTYIAAKQRIIAAAAKAQWWTGSHEEKLDVWRGDLSMPRLGLDPSQFSALEAGRGVDAIIHNGATVHWTMSYADLEDCNVGSTTELARIAACNPHIRLVYVTGGQTWHAHVQTERQMAAKVLTSRALGYSQSKFIAEAVIRRTASRTDGRMGVMIPELVIGTPGEGIVNADDYFWRLVVACIQIGAYNQGDIEAWLPISDAESVATAIISAVTHKKVPEETKIVDGMTWGHFWDMLHQASYPLQAMEPEAWSSAVLQDINKAREDHPLWPLAEFFEKEGTDDIAIRGTIRQTSLRLQAAVRKSIQTLVSTDLLPQRENQARWARRFSEKIAHSALFTRSG